MSSFNVAANRQLPPARRLNDIEYARIGSMSLRLDASLPEGMNSSPAVIIVHGGGWITGDKRANVEPLFAPLEDAGFAWFSINYSLATDISQFGAGIDDVVSAIRFVRAHAAEYRIDSQQIALIGESAGGQLAAMAALRSGADTSVQGVVALYTPTDLVTLAKNSDYVPRAVRDAVQGTPWESFVLAGLAQLSPINCVRRNMPPFLLIHGTADALVPFKQSSDMCNRMRAAGASCDLYPVQGGGHGIRWWESYPNLASAYKIKIVDWLRLNLGADKFYRPAS